MNLLSLLKVPITVVTVNLSPADTDKLLADTQALLPKNLITVKQVVESAVPKGKFDTPIARWKSVMCGPFGARDELILVLHNQSALYGMANICYKPRRCTLAYASVDLSEPLLSAIVVAHELLHGHGAVHHPGRNIMSPGALETASTRVRGDTRRELKECRREYF